jgi:hypothetical protein
LNLALVVLVGLHLALNWDWLIAALRRHRPGRPGLAIMQHAPGPAARRRLGFLSWFGRAMAVLLVASVSAGAAYFSMKAILLQNMRARIERVAAAGTHARERTQSVPPATAPARSLAPRNRPISMRNAPDLGGTLALTVFVAVIGRYVFRLRL